MIYLPSYHHGGSSLVLVQHGAGRGQDSITSQCEELPEITYCVDPKEDKAERLSEVWRRKGVEAVPVKQACQEVDLKLPDGPRCLAIDEVKPMAKVIERDKVNPIIVQWIVRSPGEDGMVTGFTGTLLPEDEETRREAMLLLDSLAPSAPPQSSRNLWSVNELNADKAWWMRQRISKDTTRRLASLDREPKGLTRDALTLFWSFERYPLKVVSRGENHTRREVEEKALDLETSLNAFAVAVASKKQVDVFVIREERATRFVKIHQVYQPFVSRREVNPTSVVLPYRKTRDYTVPAIVTD
jgi:hypothetical protein